MEVAILYIAGMEVQHVAVWRNSASPFVAVVLELLSKISALEVIIRCANLCMDCMLSGWEDLAGFP